MIHFGKSPHEDKVIIEVSDEDLVHLHSLLSSTQLPERQGPFYGIKQLIENDSELSKWLSNNANS